jgi:tight adherence protein B
MPILVGALLIGLAAAGMMLFAGAWSRRRSIEHRALEQIGLRERRVGTPSRLAFDRGQITLGGISLVVAVAGVVLMGPVGAVWGALPVVIVTTGRHRAQRKRAEALAVELAPALQLVVDNLRVGRDLVTALAEVSTSAVEPVRSIFASVVAETRVGTRVDEALATVAEAEGDRHLSVVSSAVGLHIEHGGNLVEILSSVVETIEEEDRLRRTIAAVTADGRLSGQVLLALPIFALAAVSVINPGYALPLIETPVGRLMSVAAVILSVTGWLWLRVLARPAVLG